MTGKSTSYNSNFRVFYILLVKRIPIKLLPNRQKKVFRPHIPCQLRITLCRVNVFCFNATNQLLPTQYFAS